MASPLKMTEMYDNALLGILQHVGNIQDFLQIYFGFLYRKTDFYRLLSGPGDKMGFPPGVAEKMVLKTFKLFEKLAEHDRERMLSELQRREENRGVPQSVQELEVPSEPHQETQEQSTEAAQVESSASDAVDASGPAASDATSSSSSGPAAQGDQAAAASTKSAEHQDTFQSNADSYNGAVRENYSWSQDYMDVEVRVFVPKTVVKGRQVSVNLQTSSMRVSVRDGAEDKTLMEGEFTHKINTENSLWSLEPGNCVVLSLSKTSEVWWNAVLKGEKEIDINQINRERSMATVDDEEHAVLDRLTFDYHQKLQGKPQSHEMKVHEMLKKGWDAEGSPFKGQQFDPSMFDIPPSAVQF
ncbi:nudC domain-containing protein 3 isoform X2 [Amphiprion ocellaris]|uniref:nudC domain-containing protein 3 isoform X2 n=1 Tax=Amphiprion ocellaris TaxID=80972 RepID=UPI000C30F7DF|nr:nudC domain-containing protein 3 isoform X2 [Amphiprion ocellaris]